MPCVQNEIVLSQRMGFIRLAIRHGADLVPTFVFGEKWLHKYVNVYNVAIVRLGMLTLALCPLIAAGTRRRASFPSSSAHSRSR